MDQSSLGIENKHISSSSEEVINTSDELMDADLVDNLVVGDTADQPDTSGVNRIAERRTPQMAVKQVDGMTIA